MLGLLGESVPESARGVHYVIGAAVLIDPAQRDEAEARAQKLIDGRRRAFHWKDEGTLRRSAMIDLLGELDLGMFAVIHHPVAAKRQVDARRRSLRTLASVLCREGVDDILIESRGIQDAGDRQTLVEAVNDGVLPTKLTYSFADKSNPLMWLPDAVAGVLSEAECCKTSQWIADLQRQATIFEVRRLDAHEPRLPS
ncbi:MAG: hypothetical protein ACRD2C_17450 [Acidimicrobiales bacterium]